MSDHSDHHTTVTKKSSPFSIAIFLAVIGFLLFYFTPALESVFKTFQLTAQDAHMIYWGAVGFTSIWVMLDLVFFGPYLKLLEARDAATEGASEAATQLELEAGRLSDQYEAQIMTARRAALDTKSKEIGRAKAEANRLVEEAQTQARAALTKARIDRADELKRLLNDSSKNVEELSKLVAVQLRASSASGDKVR